MFRGSAPAKIDDKGRLKIPTEFRRTLDERYGPELFLTSIVGDSTLVYPLRVWEEVEEKLAGLPSTDRAKRKFLERVSYYGQVARLDAQGRVVIPPILRDSAQMNGEVVVSARLDHLEVWNHQRLQARFTEHPFTDDDFERLAEADI
ncbi:MAG: division/cell wall cluster transcriptional repressor MraZ [Thermoanaerobaculia bacterium]